MSKISKKVFDLKLDSRFANKVVEEVKKNTRFIILNH